MKTTELNELCRVPWRHEHTKPYQTEAGSTGVHHRHPPDTRSVRQSAALFHRVADVRTVGVVQCAGKAAANRLFEGPSGVGERRAFRTAPSRRCPKPIGHSEFVGHATHERTPRGGFSPPVHLFRQARAKARRGWTKIDYHSVLSGSHVRGRNQHGEDNAVSFVRGQAHRGGQIYRNARSPASWSGAAPPAGLCGRAIVGTHPAPFPMGLSRSRGRRAGVAAR